MHYDHFDPEFIECRSHNANGIALLCPTCHQDKTSGRLSNDRVAVAKALAKRKWRDPMWTSHFGGRNVALKIGNNIINGPCAGIKIAGYTLLRIDGSSEPDEEWKLSGNLADGIGCYAQFKENKVIASSNNWDVDLFGHLLTFRRKKGDIALQLSLNDKCIGIERMAMKWKSGLQMIINNQGDFSVKNLRNSKTGGSMEELNLCKCTFVGDGKLDHMSMFGFDTTGHYSSISFEGINFRMNGGLADLNTFINLRDMISPDMFEVG